MLKASEYDFDVFPVDKCPVSKEERDKRSNQRECNSTHGYICVSNKHFTSLIEFCSPQGARIRFEKGNERMLSEDIIEYICGKISVCLTNRGYILNSI